MKVSKVSPDKYLTGSKGRPRSPHVVAFVVMLPDTDDCLLFEDYDEYRNALGAVYRWCKRNNPDVCARSARIDGLEKWAIWKRTRHIEPLTFNPDELQERYAKLGGSKNESKNENKI